VAELFMLEPRGADYGAQATQGLCLCLGAAAYRHGRARLVIDVLPASLVAALGMVLAYIPTLMAAMSAAPQEQAGLAALTALTTSQGAGVLSELPALTDRFRRVQRGLPRSGRHRRRRLARQPQSPPPPRPPDERPAQRQHAGY
jgi:hypothetical protein